MKYPLLRYVLVFLVAMIGWVALGNALDYLIFGPAIWGAMFGLPYGLIASNMYINRYMW